MSRLTVSTLTVSTLTLSTLTVSTLSTLLLLFIYPLLVPPPFRPSPSQPLYLPRLCPSKGRTNPLESVLQSNSLKVIGMIVARNKHI